MSARQMAVATAAAGAIVLAGCGSAGKSFDRIPGDQLTIYASVPLDGASRVSGEAVVRGARLALSQAQGRIGRYRIVFRALDDSTAAAGEWDPGQTSINAHQAVADRTTIGYVGDFNSGASAIAIPLLNRVGIPQIGTSSTAVGLTSDAPGASPGEPQKYYPTGERTYARIVPNDAVQAAVQVRLQRSQGCTKTYVLDDGEFDGQDMATTFKAAAQSGTPQVVAEQEFDPKATDYTSLAADVVQSAADCVLISAITENHAVLLTEQVAAAVPRARIFASAGVAESTFANPALGGIPETLDARVLVTAATLAPAAYPAAGRAFLADYHRLYGAAEPAAIYGYEAMNLLLGAIGRATDGGRASARRSRVVAAIFATRDRHGAIGTYSIDRLGDTTLTRYGVYRIVRGRLEFWRAIGT